MFEILAGLLGGVFGGVFRLAPEVLKFIDKKDERKHELSGTVCYGQRGGMVCLCDLGSGAAWHHLGNLWDVRCCQGVKPSSGYAGQR